MTDNRRIMSTDLHSQNPPDFTGRSVAAQPLFQAFPDDVQCELRRGAIRKNFSDGQFLYHRGDPADGFWLIEKGQVKIGHFSAQGDMQALMIVGPGDSFGELACIGRFERVVDAQAMGRVELLWISEAVLNAAMQSPPVGRDLLRILAAQLQEALNHLMIFRNLPATKRLAQRLLALCEGKPAPVSVGIRQHELAELVGVSRMTIGTSLGQLEQLGLLSRHYRHLVIHEPEALRRWINS